MGIAAALGVGEDVELDLADAGVELHGERQVLVIESFVRVGVLCLLDLGLTRRDAGVIAVVRADHLDLVEL